MDLREDTGYALIGAGAAAAHTGEARIAAMLLGKAHTIFDESEFFVQLLRAGGRRQGARHGFTALGDEGADRALAEGSALDDAQACDLVRSGREPATATSIRDPALSRSVGSPDSSQ